jgi:peptide deformylase
MRQPPEVYTERNVIRDVLQLGDPRLREKCAEVDNPCDPSIRELASDLRDTVRDWRRRTGYGRAIAAPQIGVLQRVVVLDVPKELALVNPEIIEQSPKKMVVWDSCLSFLFLFLQVERRCWIRVRYRDCDGETHELLADQAGDLAELLQHEIDHLDGILALDRVADPKSLCAREEFEKRYRADSPYAVGS